MAPAGRPVVLGPPGSACALVAAALRLRGFPAASSGDPGESGEQSVGPGRADPTVIVLVSPAAPEWELARRSAAGVVLVADERLSDAEMFEAVLQGADAVVGTDGSMHTLAATVEAVARGEAVLNPVVVRRLAAAARAGSRAASADSAGLRLTPRERDILQSAVLGRCGKQTARSMGVTLKTVENLQTRLFRKLGARNRAHAVTIAHRLGLLPPAEGPPGPERVP